MDLLPPCKKPKLEGNGAAWRGGGGEPLGNFILDQENALTSMGNIVLLRKKIKLEDDGVAQASWRGGDEPPGNLILDRKDALASRKKLKLEDNGVAQPSGSGGDEEPPGNSILDQEDALASLGDHILLGKRPKLEEEGFAPPSVQGGDQEPPGNSILDQEDALASPGDRLLHREKPKLEDKPPANSIMDQEKALLSLIEYRSKEVELLKQMVAYYRSQADMAEKRLLEAQLQLTRIRAQEDVEKGSLTKINTSLNGAGALYGSVVQSQSSLLSNPMVFSAEAQVPEAATGLKPTSSSLETSMLSRPLRGSLEKTGNKSKTLFAEKGHQVFFQCVRKSASSSRLDILPSTYICGQHKRKLRTLVLNPVDDHVFLTSL
ncbi:hypothetical protein AXF42_Ash018212 [Apostasia shenzhenica]|uniref:Uncharacterized protein n=1 Tax=Apostasia shenzhenica TaxID=1088818 RepID=A0A2I0B1E1_9ASPA|nr:hypothetical protein AXF42_Ash018212 [Apostasia shenzhenica]